MFNAENGKPETIIKEISQQIEKGEDEIKSKYNKLIG